MWTDLSRADISKSWGKVVSGEVVRLITLKNVNGELRKLISMERTAPPYYESVKKTIQYLVTELKKYPVQVLRIDVKWPGQPVRREKSYPVVVSFGNNAEKKVVFTNPFVKQTVEELNLYIRAQRSDVDLMDMREYHYIQQDIKRESVKRIDRSIILDDALIEIAPKSSMTFYLDIPFDWPPGEYMSQIIKEDYGNQENKSVLFGILYSPKQAIVVKGVSKPGDEQLESESYEDVPDEEDNE